MTFSSAYHQTFSGIINEEQYDFDVKYNARFDFWSMAISKEDEVLAAGINLVAKTQLTEQYPNIPFNLYSSDDDDANGDNIEQFTLAVSLK